MEAEIVPAKVIRVNDDPANKEYTVKFLTTDKWLAEWSMVGWRRLHQSVTRPTGAGNAARKHDGSVARSGCQCSY